MQSSNPLLLLRNPGRLSFNGFMSLCDVSLTILVYFLVVSRLIQAWGLAELGLWSLVMGFVAFLRMLDPGGAGSVTRFIAGCKNEKLARAEFADSAALFSLSIFTLISLLGYFPILYLVHSSVNDQYLTASTDLVFGLLLLLPLNILTLGQLAALDGIGRADLRSGISIFATLAYGSVAYVLIPKFGVMALVYGQALQWGVGILLARLLLSRHLEYAHFMPRYFSLARITEMVRFGFSLQLAGIPISLFDALNRVLIGSFAGLDRLGLYDLAYKFSLSARQVVQAALRPVFPEFAWLLSTDNAAARAKFMTVSRFALISASLVSTMQILSTPLASYLLMGELNLLFVLVASALSMGWGLANIGLPIQFYSRAAAVLRWAHLGQWTVLVMGVSLVFLANEIAGGEMILLAPASAIATGHLLTAAGEARYFRLNPIDSRHGRVALGSLLAFVVISLAVIAFAGFLMAST